MVSWCIGVVGNCSQEVEGWLGQGVVGGGGG